jgi:hypothetical protein
LKSAHEEQLNEVPQMQTWGGGIKAAVKSYRLRFQRSTESFCVCGDMNKTAPLEFLKDRGERRIVALLDDGACL